MNVCLVSFMNIIHDFLNLNTLMIFNCFARFITIRLLDISLFNNLNIYIHTRILYKLNIEMLYDIIIYNCRSQLLLIITYNVFTFCN